MNEQEDTVKSIMAIIMTTNVMVTNVSILVDIWQNVRYSSSLTKAWIHDTQFHNGDVEHPELIFCKKKWHPQKQFGCTLH